MTVLKSDTEEEITYRIVGDERRISRWVSSRSIHRSPVASIGKEVDDVAIIKTPAGDVEYEILEVKYL